MSLSTTIPTTSEPSKMETEAPKIVSAANESKDEEQQISVPQQDKTENNEIPSQIKKGKILLNDQQWEPAVEFFSTILENLTRDQQVSNSFISEIYFLYGKALFRLSQSQDDLFGSAIREKQHEYAALKAVTEEEGAEDVEMEETETEMEEATSNENNSEQTAKTTGQKEQEPELTEENDSKEQDPQAVLVNAFASIFDQALAMKAELEAQSAAVKAANGGADIDTSEDRALAWESLETARTLLSDECQTDSSKLELLGDVHLVLAELQMEDESFDSAMKDFESTVKIYEKAKLSPRRIASVFVLWACCAQYNGNQSKAKELFEASAELLLQQIVELTKQDVCDGGPKSESISLISKKEEILENAMKWISNAESAEEQVKSDLVELKSLFEEMMERVSEVVNSEKEQQEVNDLLKENDGNVQSNGVTTIGFGDVEMDVSKGGDVPINNLGVVTMKPKKKRTADEAGLENPEAKKQRVE